MIRDSDKVPNLVLWLSYGGGPLLLLVDKGHQKLIEFYSRSYHSK
jgi:hypothetical protein